MQRGRPWGQKWLKWKKRAANRPQRHAKPHTDLKFLLNAVRGCGSYHHWQAVPGPGKSVKTSSGMTGGVCASCAAFLAESTSACIVSMALLVAAVTELASAPFEAGSAAIESDDAVSASRIWVMLRARQPICALMCRRGRALLALRRDVADAEVGADLVDDALDGLQRGRDRVLDGGDDGRVAADVGRRRREVRERGLHVHEQLVRLQRRDRLRRVLDLQRMISPRRNKTGQPRTACCSAVCRGRVSECGAMQCNAHAYVP